MNWKRTKKNYGKNWKMRTCMKMRRTYNSTMNF
jgi:hypothetical protein